MATQKEQTLQIKQFRGVDRFTEGTAQDPDVFETIQNMSVANPGELKAINGVTQLGSVTGITKILHVDNFETETDNGIVVIGTTDPSLTLSAPSGWSVTPSGSTGTTTSFDFYIEYVYPGNGSISTKIGSVAVRDNSQFVDISLSGTVPSGVMSINYWAKKTAAGLDAIVFCGYSFRVNGVFNTTRTIYVNFGNGPTTSWLTCPFPPGSFDYSTSSTVDGTLVSNKTYYLALAGWFPKVYYASVAYTASASLYNTGSSVLSAYLPAGKNAITFTFKYCPYSGLEDGTTGQIGATPFTMNRAMVFLGDNSEDMLPAAQTSGEAFTFAVTRFTESLTSSATGNTITSTSNVFPVGAILQCTVVGTSGLTLNQNYYVKTSTQSGNGSIITLSLTPGGTVVTLTNGTPTLGWSQVTGTIKHISHSGINSCFTQTVNTNATSTSGATSIFPNAVASRGAGLYAAIWNDVEPQSVTKQPSQIHAVYFLDKNLTASSRRDLFVNRYSTGGNLDNINYIQTNSLVMNYLYFSIPNSDTAYTWQTRIYGNRLWIVNGYNEPFYVTRNMMKAGSQTFLGGTDTYQRWPISKFIEFFKNRMCLANDQSNPSYNSSYVYFSKESGDITYFHTNAGTARSVPANSGEQSNITGLNIYSQDLSTVGSETFLVIGKEQSIFVWDGDPVKNPKQISKNTGYAGPSCYALTSFGPIFVGNDNIYLFKTSQEVVPIGYNFQDVIKNLSYDNLKKVSVVFHEDQIKIGYTDTIDLDREIWLKVIQRQGGLNTFWSGPHVMKPYQGQSSTNKWNNDNSVRVSFLDDKIYQRDDSGSFSNDGVDIPRKLKIRNLGLQADQLLKLITRLHLHLRTVENEEFDLTFESEDGSQSMVVNFTDTYNPTRHMKQVIVSQRWLARVLTLTLENTNNSDLSVYDFSILFQPMKRRLLP